MICWLLSRRIGQKRRGGRPRRDAPRRGPRNRRWINGTHARWMYRVIYAINSSRRYSKPRIKLLGDAPLREYNLERRRCPLPCQFSARHRRAERRSAYARCTSADLSVFPTGARVINVKSSNDRFFVIRLSRDRSRTRESVPRWYGHQYPRPLSRRYRSRNAPRDTRQRRSLGESYAEAGFARCRRISSVSFHVGISCADQFRHLRGS